MVEKALPAPALTRSEDRRATKGVRVARPARFLEAFALDTETIETAEPVAPSPLRRMTSEDRVARPPLSEPDWFGGRFARLVENRLRATVDPRASCRFTKVRIAKFHDTLDEPDEATLAVAATPQGGFGGFSVVDSELAARIIEASIGADPSADDEAGDARKRPLTGVDEAMMAPLISDLFTCFSAAAAEAQGIALDDGLVFRRFTRGASSILDLEPEADMIEVEVALALRAGTQAKSIRLAAPVSALEQLRGAVIEPEEAEIFDAPPDPIWDRAMRRAANRAEIKLAVVLRRMRLSVGDAADLRPGDVLPLSADGGLSVELTLSGPDGPTEERCVCTGQLGVAGDWRAVKIIEPPADNLIAHAAPYLEAVS